MKITKLLLICLCFVIAAPAVWGQAATTAAKPGILGYLDPHTGAFRPVPQVAKAEGLVPDLTTYTGTLNVTVDITIKSAGITNVSCTATASVIDNEMSSPTVFTETDVVAATGSGTSMTCSLKIPYLWVLATGPSDTISTSYTVTGTAVSGGLPQRMASRDPLDVRSVPGNGAVTYLRAGVVI
jgi:hypothetical protein